MSCLMWTGKMRQANNFPHLLSVDYQRASSIWRFASNHHLKILHEGLENAN